MKTNVKYYLFRIKRRCFKLLFDGTTLPLIGRLSISRTRRIQLAIIFYALSIGSALLLFNNYVSLFTSQKLLNANTSMLVKVLLEPIAYFAAVIYFLTLGMAFMRTIVPILIIAFLFLVDNTLNLNGFLSSLLVLSGFSIYYLQFYSNYSQFIKPTLAKTVNSSLAIFIILISVAISLSYYNGFSTRIGNLSNRLSNNISKRFNFIASNYASDTTKSFSNETLRQHVVRTMVDSNVPVTESSILLREKALVQGLGLTLAHTNDNYNSLLNDATKRQVDLTIKNYRKILIIIVPFTFFFVTDVLANVSSNIAWGMLVLTEWSFRKRLLPETDP